MPFDIKTFIPTKKENKPFDIKTFTPLLEDKPIPKVTTPISELSTTMPTSEQWKAAGLAAPEIEKGGPTLFELIGIPSKRYPAEAPVPVSEKPEWFTRMEAPIFGFFKKATDIPFHLFGQFGLDTIKQRKEFETLIKQEYEDKLPSAVYAEKHPAGLWLGEAAGAFAPYIIAMGTGAPLPLTFGTIGGLSEAARQIGMPEEDLTPLQRGGKIAVGAAGGVISGFIFVGARMAPSTGKAIYEMAVGSGATTITESLLQDLISKRSPNVPQALLAGASQMITMALVGIVSETLQFRSIVQTEAERLVKQGHPRVLRDPRFTIRPGEKISYRQAKAIVKEYGGRKPSELSPRFRNRMVLEQRKIALQNIRKYAEELGISEVEARAFLETTAPRKAMSMIDRAIAKRIEFLNRKKISIIDDRKVMQLMRMERWIKDGMSPGEAVVLNEVYSKMQPKVKITEVTELRGVQVKQAQVAKAKIAARIVKEGQVIRGLKGEKLAEMPPVPLAKVPEVPEIKPKPPVAEAIVPEAIPEVAPELKPLIAEAKKYKTAEEFVEAQPKVYHGTSAEEIKEFTLQKRYDLGGLVTRREAKAPIISFTESLEAAKRFAQLRGGKTVIEATISKDAKVLDLVPEKGKFEEVINKVKQFDPELADDIDEARADFHDAIEDPNFIQKAKDAGYDAVRFVEPKDTLAPGGISIAVINPKVIKTKQQLTDFWRQAQVEPAVVPPEVAVPPVKVPTPEALAQARAKGIEVIGGYYDPNTGEIYIKGDMPKWATEVTKFHEQLHKIFDENPTLLGQIRAELKIEDEEEILRVMGQAKTLGGATDSMAANKLIYEGLPEPKPAVPPTPRIDQRKADMEEWITPTITDKLMMTEREFLQKYITENKSLGQIATETGEDITHVEKLEKWTYASMQRAIEETIEEQYAERDIVEKAGLKEFLRLKKELKDYLGNKLNPKLKTEEEYHNLAMLPWLWAEEGKGSRPDVLASEIVGMGYPIEATEEDVIGLIEQYFKEELQEKARKVAAQFEKKITREEKAELQRAIKAGKPRPAKLERKITGVGNGSVISTRKDIDYVKRREIFSGMPFALLGNKAETLARLTEKFKNVIRLGVKNVYDLWGGAKGYRSGLFPDIPGENYHLNELSEDRNNYYRNVQNPKTQPKIKAELEKISADFEVMMREAFGLKESVSDKEFIDKLNSWMKMGMERKRYFFAREVIQEWGDVLFEEAKADKFKSPESSAKYYFLENTSIFGITERGWSQGVIRTSKGDSEFLNVIEKLYKLDKKLDTELSRDQNIPLTKEDAWKAMEKLTGDIKAGKVKAEETVVLIDPQYLNPSEAQGTYTVGLKDTTFKGHKEGLEKYLKPLIDTGVKIIYTNNVDVDLIKWFQDNNLPYNIQERIGAVAERRGRNEIISFIGFRLGPEWTVGPILPTREAVLGERPQYVVPIPTGQSAKFSAWLRRVEAEEIEYGEAITRQGKLKRRIYANAAVRGISKAAIDKVVKKETKRSSISARGFEDYELNKVLDAIKRVRPKRIGGREVITKRTEDAIKKTRDNMIRDEELTQEMYDKILEDMDIQRPEYVGSFQFITERRGKELLFAMRSLGNIYKNIVQFENAYEKNPPVKTYVDTIDDVNPVQAVPKLSAILDAHHAYDNLELQTKLPFGMAFEQTRAHWHEAQRDIEEITMKVLEQGGKNWNWIVADEQSLERMQQYIGYKRPAYVRGRPGYPEGITGEEKAIVDAMIEYGESVKNDIRYDRVLQWIKDGTRIPNAPAKELAKAEYIYFTEGSEALRKWLEGKSWGVITGGAYDFGEVVKGRIRLYKVKPGITKKGLISKETIQYSKYDTDLVRRFKSYVRGVTLRKHLRHDVYSIKTLIETAQNLFDDPRRTLDAVNRNLLEILGQRTSTPQFLEDFLRNLYSQAARTLFLDARKGIRNLFQNLALFTSIEDALKALPLSKEDMDYFNTYVKQEKSIKYDYLYAGMKGIPFLKTVNDLADLINVMGRTDTINRYVAFRMKLGAVREAIKNNPGYLETSGTLDKMMKDAGLGDLTAMERKHALNKLITEDEDGFARYVTKATVEKVHFLYTRFERGMAEQGNELSKVLSNLLVFRKGYVQRIALDISKLRPSQEAVEAPIAARRRAARSIFTAIVVATLVGQLYRWLTNDRRNPYRPDSIVGGISLGGLVTGSQEKLNQFTSSLIAAMTGDKKAIAKLPSLITGSANMFLPFYDEIINLIETGTDTKNIDRKFLREMRMLIDKEYKLRKTSYEIERSLIEKMQHVAFGTERGEPKKKKYK